MDVLLDFSEVLLTGDISLAGADLASDVGLKTAVVISLFTDRRASADDVIPGGGTDARGWWGDGLSAIDNDQIGSRLWLLAREKETLEVIVRIEEYATEALQWLIEDGIAKRVTVAAEIVQPGMWGLSVVIEKPFADNVEFRFSHLWEGV